MPAKAVPMLHCLSIGDHRLFKNGQLSSQCFCLLKEAIVVVKACRGLPVREAGGHEDAFES